MVERGGLENRYTLTGIGGSNPSRSVLEPYKASTETLEASYSGITTVC